MTLLDPPTRTPRRPRPRVAVPRRPAANSEPGDEPRLARLNVDQYHAMIDAGVLPSGTPIELIDGQLVWKNRSAVGEDPMSVGTGHAYSINALTRLDGRLSRLGCHVRIQLPVTLPPSQEPEPDAVIVRGKMEGYATRHPGPADVLCAIEVSESSLAYDRGTKLRLYADAGIEMYVILNLIGRAAEQHAGPLIGSGRYADTRTLSVRDKLTFPVAKGKGLTVPVKSLLPPLTPP